MALTQTRSSRRLAPGPHVGPTSWRRNPGQTVLGAVKASRGLTRCQARRKGGPVRHGEGNIARDTTVFYGSSIPAQRQMAVEAVWRAVCDRLEGAGSESRRQVCYYQSDAGGLECDLKGGNETLSINILTASSNMALKRESNPILTKSLLTGHEWANTTEAQTEVSERGRVPLLSGGRHLSLALHTSLLPHFPSVTPMTIINSFPYLIPC